MTNDASAPVAAGNATFSREKSECIRFYTIYRGPSSVAQAIPRSAATGSKRSIAIVDTKRGVDAARTLESAAAGGDSWSSPLLSSLAVELRKLFVTQASTIKDLVSAVERRDTVGYRTASDRLIGEDRVVLDVDARFLAACGERLASKGGTLPGVGRLAPHVIQRIVRAHYDAFRKCYEAGLARNPALEGVVQVRFLIDEHGTVAKAAASPKGPLLNPDLEAFWAALEVTPPRNGPVDLLPDPEVVSCVVQNYRTLRFPPPEGGEVTVVYPIHFSPSETP